MKHTDKDIRALINKRRAELKRYDIFSKLPKEERDKLAAMGVYDDGSNRNKDARVIHRTGGGFSIKK